MYSRLARAIVVLSALGSFAVPNTPSVAAEAQARPVAPATGRGEPELATVAAERRVQIVRARAAGTPVEGRVAAESRIEAAGRVVDREAARAETAVIERLAQELGLAPATLRAEHRELGAWWSEILITHTLIVGSGSSLTVGQLIELHKDGMGWTQIAHGMGLSIPHAVLAIQAESRVALGQARPDGKIPAIRPAPAALLGTLPDELRGYDAADASTDARTATQ